VARVIHEQDGDYHVDVAPANGYKRFLDADNYSAQYGQLVTEIIPGQSFPAPHVGERIAVFGTWVYDSDHGWNEIHPIWAITNLDTGMTVASLPVVPPRYQPDGGGGSGGGGGGGSCGSSSGYYTSSYPTAYLIYPASNPDWHDLSQNYLRHYCSLAAVEQAYPGRSVDTDG
jgi:hypothetical protein